MKSSVILILLASFKVSCSDSGKIVPPGQALYKGTLLFGFEVSSYKPCNMNESWWVTSDNDELFRKYQSVAQSHPQTTIFAALFGVPSDTGHYGHLGSYRRTFTVERVQEVRVAEAGDCQ